MKDWKAEYEKMRGTYHYLLKMLRHKEGRIAELEKDLYMLERHHERLCTKQSEPVNHYEPTAWINHIKQTGGDFYELNVSGRGEPLYKHPPQTKPLSDEEIGLLTTDKRWSHIEAPLLKDFARAIEERHGIK